MNTRNRTRDTDGKAEDVVDDGVVDHEAETADEDVSVKETIRSESPAEPVEMRLVGPFKAEGCNVLDAEGNRIAICGYDHNRAKSGPGIAEVVASSLNRTVK